MPTAHNEPLTITPPPNELAALIQLSSLALVEKVTISRSSPLNVQLPSSRANIVGDVEEYPVHPVREARADGDGGLLGVLPPHAANAIPAMTTTAVTPRLFTMPSSRFGLSIRPRWIPYSTRVQQRYRLRAAPWDCERPPDLLQRPRTTSSPIVCIGEHRQDRSSARRSLRIGQHGEEPFPVRRDCVLGFVASPGQYLVTARNQSVAVQRRQQGPHHVGQPGVSLAEV